MTTRATGIALAFVTAVVSGVAVYVNSRGVAHFGDATVYTTAKNALAGALLLTLALPLLAGPRTSGGRATLPATRGQWLGVVAVACLGGSVPFVLFFEGLARASSPQAAFVHKTWCCGSHCWRYPSSRSGCSGAIGWRSVCSSSARWASRGALPRHSGRPGC